MASKLGYDSYVKRLNSAPVAALALVVGGFVSLACRFPANAQINGTPASVTSTNFGGHPNSTPGVPASITSLGPNGIQPRNPFPNQPACCINPLFPVNPNPPITGITITRRGQFFPGGGAVYMPYAYPVVGEPDAGDAAAEQQDNQRAKMMTVAGRLSSIAAARERRPVPMRRHLSAAAKSIPSRKLRQPQRPPPDETPVPDQPQTLLVFKDGHQLEVQNYAVIGDTLYDLTPGRHHKIRARRT